MNAHRLTQFAACASFSFAQALVLDVASAASDEAEATYIKTLSAPGAHGPALNNLAVLAVRKGDAEVATRYFEQAIASNDAHKAFYALNYSRFLQPRDKPRAAAAARIAVEAAPDSPIALRQLGETLWQANPKEMLPLAIELVGRGHTDIATEFAMRCLRSQKRPAEERRGWLILLASRLANEYSISKEVRDAMARDLASLSVDSEIGRGSQQLRAVIDAPPRQPTDVDWWASQTSIIDPNKKSGRAAIKDVLLAAGEAQLRNPTAAEQYFRAAIDLGEHGPDPDAFFRLVELYATSKATTQLNTNVTRGYQELMERYQGELFIEKSGAYRREDWPLIYRLHLALGMAYAQLGVWKSDMVFQNAIFQLSHAMSAAAEVNRKAEQEGRATRTALPAIAVRKLAEGYRATGQPDLAATALLSGAEALRAAGYARDSQDVTAAIDVKELRTFDAAARAKYEQLHRVQRQ